MLTLDEICDKIRSDYDVDLVCELLDISVDEILDRFDYKITKHWDRLQEELSDDYDIWNNDEPLGCSEDW